MGSSKHFLHTKSPDGHLTLHATTSNRITGPTEELRVNPRLLAICPDQGLHSLVFTLETAEILIVVKIGALALLGVDALPFVDT